MKARSQFGYVLLQIGAGVVFAFSFRFFSVFFQAVLFALGLAVVFIAHIRLSKAYSRFGARSSTARCSQINRAVRHHRLALGLVLGMVLFHALNFFLLDGFQMYWLPLALILTGAALALPDILSRELPRQ